MIWVSSSSGTRGTDHQKATHLHTFSKTSEERAALRLWPVDVPGNILEEVTSGHHAPKDRSPVSRRLLNGDDLFLASEGQEGDALPGTAAVMRSVAASCALSGPFSAAVFAVSFQVVSLERWDLAWL